MSWGLSSSTPVVFEYAGWVTAYPQFGNVSPGQAQEFFNRICDPGGSALINNTPTSPIPYCPTATPPVRTRLFILNAAVAHLAYLETPDASGNVRPVGRISQAAEGSVSLGLEYAAPQTDSQAFWNQSTYGAYVWIALLPFRSAKYIPGPPQNPYGGILGRRGGFYVGGRGRGF